MADLLKVFQVVAQVEYDAPPVLKVFQVIAQVEYEPTLPGHFKYYGNIPVAVTPASPNHPEFIKTGTVPVAVTPESEYYQQNPGEFVYLGNIGVTVTPQAAVTREWTYVGVIPCTVTPSCVVEIPVHFYEGNIGIEVTPSSTYRVPIIGWDKYTGYGMTDISFLSEDPPFWGVVGTIVITIDPAAASIETTGETIIPLSTGGFEMGGEGVWSESVPGEDEIVTTGGFKLAGTGSPATSRPPGPEVILGEGGYDLGGAGVFSSWVPPPIPDDVLVGTGGFILGGTGQLPAITPTTTVLVGSGGYKFGGLRPDPVEVTYPGVYDRIIEATVAFEMAGVGSLETIAPGTTAIVSRGAIFTLGGAGLAATKSPPLVVIAGDALGGFILGGGDGEVFEAWVLSGHNFEPSIFSGFKFNSFAQHQGQTFAAGEDGIYLLGGDTDAGELIHTGARIGPINFGNDKDKRIRSVQFGSGGNGTSVRVKSEEGEGVFKTERDKNRVVVSRDIQGREFIIDILDFQELSQFEATPLKLARR